MIARASRFAAAFLFLLPALPGLAAAQDASKCKMDLIANLPVQMEGSRASVAVGVNGAPTRLWLDSGAFFNFMPKARAVELGLRVTPAPPGLSVRGVGGAFSPELAVVHDFALSGAMLHDVAFVVGGSDHGNGYLGANLLGMWDTEFDLANGYVRLFRESRCERLNIAYWSKGMSIGVARTLPADEDDNHIYVEVSIDGRPVRAVLDSGAPTSFLSPRAARLAGIDLGAPQVVASANIGGVGKQLRKSWIVRTKLISIGGEDIRNSPIRVLDDSADDGDDGSDMILGMDFLISHHVLVSKPQRRMFLTYNGGAIFSASTDGEIGHQNTRAENMGPAEQAPAPTTADGFAGRASARLTRGDAPGAIADFSEAIRLAPGRADLLGTRAEAYLKAGQPVPALADIDAAIAIAPRDHKLLIRRARLRLARGDRPGALADADLAAAAASAGSLDMKAITALYAKVGRADRALELIDPVIALHREDNVYPELLDERSWYRALANRELVAARQDLEIALRKRGPDPDMLDTRALIKYREKDFAGAIADENAALDKVPNYAGALFVRGLARIANGDAAGGAADLAQARAIKPDIDTRFTSYLSVPGAPATPATETSLPAMKTVDQD